jgi:hypothetical protein
VGFDASEAGRDPDAERLLRSSYPPSMNYEVRKLQKMLRSFGIDRTLASFKASIVPPSDVLKQARNAAYLGLGISIAVAFEAHGLDSVNIAAWSLRRSAQSIRTPALRSVLKAATTFGPIVVLPDYEDDAPFDYHPNLEWLLPETATVSGDAWDVVVAFAQGVAVHHHNKALLSVIGNGMRVVIHVCTHPAAAGAIGGVISAPLGYEIGGVVGAAFGGATGPLITYVLTRR